MNPLQNGMAHHENGSRWSEPERLIRKAAGVLIRRKCILARGSLRAVLSRIPAAGRAASAPQVIAPQNVNARRRRVHSANRFWASGINHVPYHRGRLYIAVTMDLFSRRIVGWSTGARRKDALILTSLGAAIRARKPVPSFIRHTAPGAQFGTDLWGNSVVRSFFGTLFCEILAGERFSSRDRALYGVANAIERWYNTERSHSTLDYHSPAEFERLHEERGRDVEALR